jgi:hypothetical protein
VTSLIDTTTDRGEPMFCERTREYLRRVLAAGPAALAPYATTRCPECAEHVAGDGLVPTADGAAHVMVGGSVVVGCEGYFVVNPNPLGIHSPNWEDWR